jgi:hypothetical protein
MKSALRCSKILTKHDLIFGLSTNDRSNEFGFNMLNSDHKVRRDRFRSEMARRLLYTGSRKRIYSSYANCNSTVGFFLNLTVSGRQI